MTALTIINGRLRVNSCGGTLLLAKSETKGCCCGCKYCVYFSQHDECRETTLGNRKYQQTITVPNWMTLPVKVTAVGGVDDVFMLDGDGSVFGQNPAPNFGTPAHGIEYEWVQNNRTFTVEALDTRGGCTGITYTICMMPLDTSPTELCEPLEVLSGSDPPPPGLVP